MAPRTRKAAASPAPATHNGDTPPPLSSKDDAPPTPSAGVDALLVPVATEEREEVKVNNASATDMKHACDDALKRVSTLSLSAALSSFASLKATWDAGFRCVLR